MSCRNHVTNHLMVDNNKEREVINRTENKKNNTEIILDLAGDDNAAAGCEPNKGARPQRKIQQKYFGKVSRKNAAVLFDFVQMRGGGGPGPIFLSPFVTTTLLLGVSQTRVHDLKYSRRVWKKNTI